MARLAHLVAEGRGEPMPIHPAQRIGPPHRPAREFVCIVLNHADHAAESGAEPPAELVVFFKAPNIVVGPDDDVLIPVAGEKTDLTRMLFGETSGPGRLQSAIPGVYPTGHGIPS